MRPAGNGGPARQTPSILQQLRDHRPPPPERPADYRLSVPPAEAHASGEAVHDAYAPGEEPAELPMEAAKPTERSHEARSHENPAGPPRRPQQTAYEPQNATATVYRAGEYETPPAPVPAPYSAENTPFAHHNATADAPTVPQDPEETEEPRQPGRLQFEREQTPASGAKPRRGAHRQHGTKYHQTFTPDAAKPGKDKTPTGPPKAPYKTDNPPNTRQTATAGAASAPERPEEPRQPGRLRFEGEQRPPGTEPRQGAATKQHGTA
jgi:hypothetical protein